MVIRAPKTKPADPDFTLECERSLDEAVRDLVDEAIIAGWPAPAVYDALASVILNQRISYAEDPDPAADA